MCHTSDKSVNECAATDMGVMIRHFARVLQLQQVYNRVTARNREAPMLIQVTHVDACSHLMS